jgi:hypothetical protein
MSQELANMEPQGLMASAVKPAQIMAVINHVHEILKGAMKEGKPDASGNWNGEGDFAIIPGTPKKSLLKPGAEKLLLSFGLAAVARTPQIVDLGGGHREVIIETEIRSINTGRLHAVGIGSCSTMEAKYRYRNVSDYTILDEPIPKDAKEQKQSYRRKGYGMKKIEGVWHWVKFGDERKEENTDIADTYNTVLKMADKRSMVNGAIRATASSGMFTQDLEEEEPEDGAPQGSTMPERPQAPQPQAPSAKAPAPTGETLTGAVAAVSLMDSKPGDAKPWHKTSIKIGEVWYGTFDKDLGAKVENLKGCNVTITFKKDGKYFTLLACEPEVREPGQEG